jgi:hypothetical protein
MDGFLAEALAKAKREMAQMWAAPMNARLMAC